jgi:hypothetical protein
MKKLFILSLLFSSIFLSCSKDPEPAPQPIRAYVYLEHFVPGRESIIWVVDGVEVPDKQDYSLYFPGAVILDAASEQIEFTVKHPVSGEVLASEILPLEQNKYYTVMFAGTVEDPVLLYNEIEIARPQPGKVKIQFFHAATDQDSIDVYMGGTTPDKKVVTGLNFNDFSDPFDVSNYDATVAITVSLHSDEYDQDSVLLTSVNNDLFQTDASYLAVVAPFTVDPLSELTLWLFSLPTY